MQQQLDQYNYLRIEMDELPSRGLLYPEGTEIKGRFLTIQDVKYLSLLNEYTATRVVNEIIDRCFYMTIKIDDLLLCDREYLAFWLRANSFMKENGYKISIAHCQHCNGGFEHTIMLDDIPINYLEQIPGIITLPRSKRTISLKLPSIKDLDIVYDDHDIQFLARMVDVENPLDFVLNLNAYDYAYLTAMCKQYNVGFDMTFQIPCKHCGKTNYMQIVITDDGLFGQMNMRDIINLILRVTKYVGCYIPDTTPWPELEMIQEVTNKMVKEENEEMQKQEQKSRAQAAAMQSKYSSRYHAH